MRRSRNDVGDENAGMWACALKRTLCGKKKRRNENSKARRVPRNRRAPNVYVEISAESRQAAHVGAKAAAMRGGNRVSHHAARK